MKFRVVATATALADAQAIRRWIAERGSPLTAARFVDRLVARLQGLATNPRRCRLAPESDWFDDVEIRQYLVGSYRVLFTVVGHDVLILHIRHETRRPATASELRGARGNR